MKEKYITLEEVLALRGTDTKIYIEGQEGYGYYKFVGDILCEYYNSGNIGGVNVSLTYCNGDYYILEPEEFKVEKNGLYKTQDGQIVYVSVIDDNCVYGVVENSNFIRTWYTSGKYKDSDTETHLDLVEYIGK